MQASVLRKLRHHSIELLFFVVLGLCLPSYAQSVSVILNSGASLSIPSLIPGAMNNFSGGPLSITTSWTSLHPGGTTVALYAYFSSSTAALMHTSSGNTTDVPSGAIRVRVNGIGLYNPLSSVVPFTGTSSGARLFSQGIGGTNKSGSRMDTFDFQMDLSGVVNGQDMRQLPPDTYQGTLHIQAQVTP